MLSMCDFMCYLFYDTFFNRPHRQPSNRALHPSLSTLCLSAHIATVSKAWMSFYSQTLTAFSIWTWSEMFGTLTRWAGASTRPERRNQLPLWHTAQLHSSLEWKLQHSASWGMKGGAKGEKCGTPWSVKWEVSPVHKKGGQLRRREGAHGVLYIWSRCIARSCQGSPIHHTVAMSREQRYDWSPHNPL